MKIKISNIGKIKEADIILNGITVIAGENNTGKSTVGKVLYSVLNSLYDIDNKRYNEKFRNIETILRYCYSFNINITDDSYIRKLSEIIVNEKNNNLTIDYLYDIVVNFWENENLFGLNEDTSKIDFNKILKILTIPDDVLTYMIVSNKLNIEFEYEVDNIFTDEKGKIEINYDTSNINIDNNINKISNFKNLQSQSIYIESPFILDELRISKTTEYYNFFKGNHKYDLKNMLLKTQNSNNIIDTAIASNIIDKINEVCSGNLSFDKSKTNFINYTLDGSQHSIKVKNLSTGLKSFVILKTLLLNGSITQNSTIILDEPEIHLHPEWQLTFAQVIVLIQKEFNLNILLTTHSPYFLRAIQIFSDKYDIIDKNKYYLAENNGNIANINDVTDNIESIYEKLSRPLQTLEDLRCSDV